MNLRVAVIRLALSFLFLVFGVVLAARADEPPKKLLVPSAANYSATVVAYAEPDATEAVSFTLGDCVVGALEGNQLAPNLRPKADGYSVTLNPKGAIFINDLSAYLCKPAFALVEAPSNVVTYSMVSYAGTPHTSFKLDPLGAVEWNRKTKVLGPFINGLGFGTWVTVFPTEETPMHVRVFDVVTGQPTAVEDFIAKPPVSQYRVKAEGAFFLEIGLGDHYWQCFPSPDCSYLVPVYGFASWGDLLGGNIVAEEFQAAALPVGGGH
jgi:hypothetical protein